MKQGFFWRIPLALIVLLASTVYLVPTYTAFMQDKKAGADKHASSVDRNADSFVQRFFPDARVNLGLDLRGGIHLTLGVEVETAIRNSLTQMGRELMNSANAEGLLMTRPRLLPDDTLECTLTLPEKKAAFEEYAAKYFPQLDFSAPQTVGGKNLRYVASLRGDARSRMEDQALEQALTTIRNRIDQFGVAEPDIRKQQGGRIVIQLPGMKDTKRATDIIGKTAHLEFRSVREGLEDRSVPPPGIEFLPEFVKGDDTSQGQAGRIAVEKEPVLTGDHVTNAQVRFDNDRNEYSVSISFDRRGGDIFSRYTRDNIGRRLAIVLDNRVYSAPVIQSEIHGDASITGRFSAVEANDLAVVLRAGSLPAPVKVLEERTVGPSLGEESISMGITAALIGGALIVLFMFVYYGVSGLIADLMIIFDILLILAGMAAFGATLTLPGIAGIVLTIGMAVDANVLIYERIREELRHGLSTKAAIDLGFSRAMLAITDSNLTTVIAALILYEFGTGPIRGFAVTLTLGIIASMFTAIFVSRIIFDLWMNKPGRALSI